MFNEPFSAIISASMDRSERYYGFSITVAVATKLKMGAEVLRNIYG